MIQVMNSQASYLLHSVRSRRKSGRACGLFLFAWESLRRLRLLHGMLLAQFTSGDA